VVVGAPKGSSPVASSYSITPMAKMSLRRSPRTPTTCSGAIQAGEPTALRMLLGQQVGVVRVARQAEVQQHGAAVSA
jgi:hypothetical protein